MVDNSNMPHPKCLGSQKKPPVQNQKIVKRGQNNGSEFANIQNFALRAWHSPNDFRFIVTIENLCKLQPLPLGHRRQAICNALELLINDVVCTRNHIF